MSFIKKLGNECVRFVDGDGGTGILHALILLVTVVAVIPIFLIPFTEDKYLNDKGNVEEMCFSSDVRAFCCPSACAVKARRMPSDANAVLRGCWASLGCRGSAPSSVAMYCNCEGK